MMESRKTADAMRRKISHIARCGAERAEERAQLVRRGVVGYARVKPRCWGVAAQLEEEILSLVTTW